MRVGIGFRCCLTSREILLLRGIKSRFHREFLTLELSDRFVIVRNNLIRFITTQFFEVRVAGLVNYMHKRVASFFTVFFSYIFQFDFFRVSFALQRPAGEFVKVRFLRRRIVESIGTA